MPLEEWGFIEDYDAVIEGLSGAILIELNREGLDSEEVSALFAALLVLQRRRNGQERRPT